MTAQIGDRFLWLGERHSLMGELPLPATRWGVAPRDDHSWMNTACWRGYVATWEVRGDEFLLTDLDGRFELLGGPIPAVWISGVLRLAAGPVQSYLHMGYSTTFEAVIELDVRRGRVTRWRQLDAVPCAEDPDPLGSNGGIGPGTPAWEWLPEWQDLFLGASHEAVREGHESWAPTAAPFRQRGVRARIRQERARRRLRFGELVKLAGLPPSKGGKLAQFERGGPKLHDTMISALCAVLGVSAEDQEALRAEDDAAFEAAWNAWADEPVVPSIAVAAGGPFGREHRYFAPDEIRGDLSAMKGWATSCARLAWRPVVLTTSRRRSAWLDLDGIEARGLLSSGGGVGAP